MKAKRLQTLEDDMMIANEEYVQAVNRASEPFCLVFQGHHSIFTSTEDLHSQVSEVLRMMLSESDADVLVGWKT